MFYLGVAVTHFVDRRLNPKGKSLGNRQRFLRRARVQIREAVQKSLKDSGVTDLAKDRKIKISTKGTKEPRFRLDPRASGVYETLAEVYRADGKRQELAALRAEYHKVFSRPLR